MHQVVERRLVGGDDQAVDIEGGLWRAGCGKRRGSGCHGRSKRRRIGWRRWIRWRLGGHGGCGGRCGDCRRLRGHRARRRGRGRFLGRGGRGVGRWRGTGDLSGQHRSEHNRGNGACTQWHHSPSPTRNTETAQARRYVHRAVRDAERLDGAGAVQVVAGERLRPAGSATSQVRRVSRVATQARPWPPERCPAVRSAPRPAAARHRPGAGCSRSDS